jgi:gluconate 2-dehydrogenase gamma chain
VASGPAPAPTPVQTLDDKYLHVPPAPAAPPDPNQLQFFTLEEARSLEAFVARLLPGTPQDPGAREAGVMTFIDAMLARAESYAEPTYTAGPYARFYEGQTPPVESDQSDSDQVIWAPEKWRRNYGWQVGVPPQQLYRGGLAALEALAQARHGSGFADLSEAQQDGMLELMAPSDDDQGGGALGEQDFQTGTEGFGATAFFEMVRQHTIHGMFGDPLYGGNRFLVGWQLIGYPGARRAYTPHDLQTEGTPLEPQSLARLAPFHPGERVSDDVIIPLADGAHIQQQTDPKQDSGSLLQFCRIRR